MPAIREKFIVSMPKVAFTPKKQQINLFGHKIMSYRERIRADKASEKAAAIEATALVQEVMVKNLSTNRLRDDRYFFNVHTRRYILKKKYRDERKR